MGNRVRLFQRLIIYVIQFFIKENRGLERRLVVAFNLYVNIVRYNGVNQKACSMKSHFPNVLFSKSSVVARGCLHGFAFCFRVRLRKAGYDYHARMHEIY